MAPDTGVLTANEAVVRSAFDALNRHDVAALEPLWHRRAFPAVAAEASALLAAVPDVHLEPLVVACEDDQVLVHWRATGTFSGASLHGVRATGKAIDVAGFDCLTFERGLLRHRSGTYDGLDAARQAGLLPAAGSVGGRVLTLAANLRTVLLGLRPPS